jgi:hypothetical protein
LAADPMRNVAHTVLAVLLWILYGYYWSIVSQQPVNRHTQVALVSLGVLAAITIVILVVWIFHNLRISRRYSRRTARPPSPKESVRDYVGRWIICDDPAALLTANYIEIDIKSTKTGERTVEEKIFRTPAAG